ncbi:AraC family transcriptional regulator [Paenibacillus profundus]|uniref:AraC family transcriptional regulator n=1 Tax=Paenibacillus profundus TaxID=1173085 RepID=A0ABS8YLC6_9BACL|nr:AraC family transcriptional regulator [Paenibacillus profundus]MCE5172367.1 AraC family transcriptional regulator [Paenibacillus profundus]
MNHYDVPVSQIYPIIKTLVLQGYDVDAFYKYAAFDANLLQNAEARISAEEFERLIESASAFTQDEAFGLHQGQTIEISDLGVLGYVMMHSKTIGQALEAYQRYNVTVCSVYNIGWEVERDDVLIQVIFQDTLRQTSRHCVEEMASSLYHIMIRLSCRSIPVTGIQFAHASPSDISEHISVWGIEPQFGSVTNCIRMGKEVLEYPILFSDAQLLGVFETIAEETRNKLLQGHMFSDQLYKWITQSMPSFIPTLKDTAKAFKLSARTVQAKLKQEHTSYIQLLNRVRKELAIRYLTNPEYTVGEVAYLLHYSEPSAFQNAFKKWTGLTPGQYRADSIRG